MKTSLATGVVVGLLMLAVGACGGDDASDDGATDGDTTGIPSYQLAGTLTDFSTAAAINGATVGTLGLSPDPDVEVADAEFIIDGIAPHSVFNIVASDADHLKTINAASTVEDADVEGAAAEAVSTAFVADLATAFAATPDATKGILIVRTVDEAGNGFAGVQKATFELNGAAPGSGPFFLDADRQPDTDAVATTAGGWAVFFDVDPGLAAVTPKASSGVTMLAPQTPIEANAVSLMTIVVTVGEAPAPPTNVSFSQKIVPIFGRRGCLNCHSGGGPGKDLGGLQLDGGNAKVYKELTTELSPIANTTRVDKADPPKSLVLTMPSAETPPDRHPNITFATPNDPDYVLLLTWIKEGAKDN